MRRVFLGRPKRPRIQYNQVPMIASWASEQEWGGVHPGGNSRVPTPLQYSIGIIDNGDGTYSPETTAGTTTEWEWCVYRGFYTAMPGMDQLIECETRTGTDTSPFGIECDPPTYVTGTYTIVLTGRDTRLQQQDTKTQIVELNCDPVVDPDPIGSLNCTGFTTTGLTFDYIYDPNGSGIGVFFFRVTTPDGTTFDRTPDNTTPDPDGVFRGTQELLVDPLLFIPGDYTVELLTTNNGPVLGSCTSTLPANPALEIDNPLGNYNDDDGLIDFTVDLVQDPGNPVTYDWIVRDDQGSPIFTGQTNSPNLDDVDLPDGCIVGSVDVTATDDVTGNTDDAIGPAGGVNVPAIDLGPVSIEFLNNDPTSDQIRIQTQTTRQPAGTDLFTQFTLQNLANLGAPVIDLNSNLPPPFNQFPFDTNGTVYPSATTYSRLEPGTYRATVRTEQEGLPLPTDPCFVDEESTDFTIDPQPTPPVLANPDSRYVRNTTGLLELSVDLVDDPGNPLTYNWTVFDDDGTVLVTRTSSTPLIDDVDVGPGCIYGTFEVTATDDVTGLTSNTVTTGTDEVFIPSLDLSIVTVERPNGPASDIVRPFVTILRGIPGAEYTTTVSLTFDPNEPGVPIVDQISGQTFPITYPPSTSTNINPAYQLPDNKRYRVRIEAVQTNPPPDPLPPGANGDPNRCHQDSEIEFFDILEQPPNLTPVVNPVTYPTNGDPLLEIELPQNFAYKFYPGTICFDPYLSDENANNIPGRSFVAENTVFVTEDVRLQGGSNNSPMFIIPYFTDATWSETARTISVLTYSKQGNGGADTVQSRAYRHSTTDAWEDFTYDYLSSNNAGNDDLIFSTATPVDDGIGSGADWVIDQLVDNTQSGRPRDIPVWRTVVVPAEGSYLDGMRYLAVSSAQPFANIQVLAIGQTVDQNSTWANVRPLGYTQLVDGSGYRMSGAQGQNPVQQWNNTEARFNQEASNSSTPAFLPVPITFVPDITDRVRNPPVTFGYAGDGRLIGDNNGNGVFSQNYQSANSNGPNEFRHKIYTNWINAAELPGTFRHGVDSPRDTSTSHMVMYVSTGSLGLLGPPGQQSQVLDYENVFGTPVT